MYYVVIGAAGLIIILLFIRGLYDEKKAEKKLTEKLKSSFGSDGIKSISYEDLNSLKRYHENNSVSYTDGQIIDDITWNDLDMDKVFARIDRCCCQTGSEYLYDCLRKPVKDEKIIEERNRVMEHFSDNPDIRLSLQLILSRIGTLNGVTISDYITRLDEVSKDNSFLHYLCSVLALLSMVVIFTYPPAGFPVFFAVLVFNILTYFKRKGMIEPYIVSFAYIIRVMNAAGSLLKLKDDEISGYTERLSEHLTNLRGLKVNTFILLSGRGMTGGMLNMLLDYIRIFLHLDLIKFNKMLAIVREKNADIIELFKIVGFLDCAISVSSFRESLPVSCKPLHEKKNDAFLDIKELHHPLLKDPVPSDINTKRGVLVTGSNASGKSTFLKSVAVASLLSQSIATVPAKSYRAPFFDIYSSMSVRDDIMAGESYYMAEIKALKRILDSTSSNETPVICFIDEVLSGTNTIERIAASSQILKSLSKPEVLLFAATHDTELTWMLSDYFDNYHFSEEVEGNDIRFSYRLKPGSAQSKNAIRLLTLLGYSEEITVSAQETADLFVKENKWEKL